MAITDLPILSMLHTKMSWSQERQKVLAENVANSDTPNYRERDLKPVQFPDPTTVQTAPVHQVALAQTEPRHIPGLAGNASSFDTTRKGAFEISPTGNSVSLEDQMMKVAANQIDYQAATALYTRSLDLLKVALGKR